MSNIFDKFDKEANTEELQKAIKEAQENNYEDVPAGDYIAKIEKMELGQTKDERPMFKVMMRLIAACGDDEEKFLSKFTKKKPCIFMNRVMFGTKNDGNMIASVIGWLNVIFPDDPIEFTTYSQFADDVLDMAEECNGLEFAVNYDNGKFNSIMINDVFED